jgi:chemotaxis protein CheC
MQITTQQKDALCELINIGFGRAASALSILVGQRVLIEAPQVDLYPLTDLDGVLVSLATDEITSVHQVFVGQITGTAMLLMDTRSATVLADMLIGGAGQPHSITEEDRETIQEAGNILLNAFTGSFGNLLQVHISFAVPRVHYNTLRNMLNSLLINQHELEYALVVQVNFQLTGGSVSGYMVIVMGIHSLSALLEAMRVIGYIDD